MATRLGNQLGLTIHEDIFWKTERYRQRVGNSVNVLQSLFLPEAPEWVYDDIELRRNKMVVLAQLYDTIGAFDAQSILGGGLFRIPSCPVTMTTIDRFWLRHFHQRSHSLNVFSITVPKLQKMKRLL